jgi:outer membrane lipoprotein-sorting protein
VARFCHPADRTDDDREPPRARLSIVLLIVTVVSAQQAAAAPRATDAKAQYERALARLAQMPRFEFAETVRVAGSAPQSVWTQIRFIAPNRMRMIVRTLAPQRKQLETLQVGHVRCQIPPGVCFRAPRPKPVTMVRSFLQPRLQVRYRSVTNAASGTVVVTMTTTTRVGGGRYSAQLVIDAVTEIPRSFSMTAARGGQIYARQKATFEYNSRFKIRLPPNARTPKP